MAKKPRPAAKKPAQPTHITGPDGYERPTQVEVEINDALAQCFAGDAGAKAFMYLRSISIERVSGSNIQPEQLMHLEGMRFIVALIDQRIKLSHARNQKL